MSSTLVRLFAPARRVVVAALVIVALVGGYGVATQQASAAVLTPAQVVARLFATINAQRHAHGVPSLLSNPALARASYAHGVSMARHTLLSGQVPAEHTLGYRLTAAGYPPKYAAEIIGTTTGNPGAVLALAARLYAGSAGRAATLNRAFGSVGISLVLDHVHHKIWLTEDFGRMKPPPAAPVTAQTIAAATLSMLNLERALNHRSALSVDSRLIKSAHAHNLDMARLNTMSHRLPGEPVFTSRIQSAGYNWMNAGENIGWNSDATTSGVLALETMMYNEKAPNDGHRQNILSTAFRNVGIDVYYDAAHHKIWLTEDFGTLMP